MFLNPCERLAGIRRKIFDIRRIRVGTIESKEARDMKRWAILTSVICFIAFASMASAQTADAVQITGSYAGVYHIPEDPHQYDSKISQPEKLINEVWTFSVSGNKVTGTEKTDKGDRPFT